MRRPLDASALARWLWCRAPSTRATAGRRSLVLLGEGSRYAPTAADVGASICAFCLAPSRGGGVRRGQLPLLTSAAVRGSRWGDDVEVADVVRAVSELSTSSTAASPKGAAAAASAAALPHAWTLWVDGSAGADGGRAPSVLATLRTDADVAAACEYARARARAVRPRFRVQRAAEEGALSGRSGARLRLGGGGGRCGGGSARDLDDRSDARRREGGRRPSRRATALRLRRRIVGGGAPPGRRYRRPRGGAGGARDGAAVRRCPPRRYRVPRHARRRGVRRPRRAACGRRARLSPRARRPRPRVSRARGGRARSPRRTALAAAPAVAAAAAAVAAVVAVAAAGGSPPAAAAGSRPGAVAGARPQ